MLALENREFYRRIVVAQNLLFSFIMLVFLSGLYKNKNMNDLENYFKQNTGRLIDKWHHYFEIYEKHFSRFRGTEVHIVEFGVSQGGSLQMWKQYFGENCKIYGVDINPHCEKFAEEGIEIYIGDQADRKFLRSLAEKIPRIDILIDDGGHTMRQQKNTFKELFPYVSENGVYLCEDLHTSYWFPWGGGYRWPFSFIEYSKRYIDNLHAWHAASWCSKPLSWGLKVSDFTRSAHSLTYYDTIFVVEKAPKLEPTRSETGTRTIPDWSPPWLIRLKAILKVLGIKIKYPTMRD